MHPPVGDEDGACHAIMRHVGKRGGQCSKQARSVGFPVSLTGLDEAHIQARQMAQPFRERRAHLLGLRGAVTKFLARALVDNDDRNRGQEVAVLSRNRRICKREHKQCKRERPR